MTVAAIVARGVGEGLVALEVAGDADLSVQSELAAAIRAALNQDADVIADIAETTFLDAAVIRTLIQGYHEAMAQGSAFVLLLGTAEIVERVVKLTGIETIVPRAHTREEALEMIRIWPGRLELAL